MTVEMRVPYTLPSEEDARAGFESCVSAIYEQLEPEQGARLMHYLGTLADTGHPIPWHFHEMERLVNELIAKGEKELAGEIFNIHRVLTKTHGYDPDMDPTRDIVNEGGTGAFDFDIPEEGVILVDLFAVRNLAWIVEMCERKDVDLSRIRVRVPKSFFCAQLMEVSNVKRRGFEEACAKLAEDQFLIEDAHHVGDIEINENIALWFGPRILPIYPKLHENTEEATIDNVVEYIRSMLEKVVPGGRAFLNSLMTKQGRFEEPRAYVADGRKGGKTLKMSSLITNEVVSSIRDLLGELGDWSWIDSKIYRPTEVDLDAFEETGNPRFAKTMHLRRKTVDLVDATECSVCPEADSDDVAESGGSGAIPLARAS